jgi:hypothetical protein
VYTYKAVNNEEGYRLPAQAATQNAFQERISYV